MSKPSRIVKQIDAEREAQGLTKEELARRAGTSRATVSLYLSGAKSPLATTLERLATALGCKVMLVRNKSNRKER